MNHVIRGLAVLGLIASATLFQGCEVDSATDVQRTVGVDFTGFYKNPSGGNVTSRNSGTPISSLDLRQAGNQLEAIDNTGHIWKGTIGEFNGTTGSFELTGQTDNGAAGRFSGTLTTSSTTTNALVEVAKGIMTGTYIEDAFFATFYATATIPGLTPGDGGGDGGSGVSISPGTATLSSNGATQTFTASGGSGTYNWSLSGASGSLSATTGSSVSYVRTSSGNNTLTVSDGTDTDTVTITQP